MPSKDHLIEAIREFNGTARRDWLNQFDDASLRRYLDHLLHGQEPRGGESRWMRPADSPVMLTRNAS
ncbi:MAG: hypothetical protein QMB94_05585 [Phycisphaerales bacterium]|jgi:hypothetical protein|nr:hypothetical protein [Planctomycetota bacterium]MDA1026990.1 hypothetical protein [Planctomycetota bacterium]